MFRLNDYRICNALLSLKLLVNADDWPYFGKTKLKFYIFYPPSPKNVPAPLVITAKIFDIKLFAFLFFLINFYFGST